MRCSRAVFARAAADQREDLGEMGAGAGQAESSGGGAGAAGTQVSRHARAAGKGGGGVKHCDETNNPDAETASGARGEEREQEPQEFSQGSHIGLFRARTANLKNFAGLDFLDGQDHGWKVLAQVFQAIGG